MLEKLNPPQGGMLNNNDLLAMGMSLLAGSKPGVDSSTAISGALGSLMQSQGARGQEELARQKLAFEMAQEQRIRDQFEKNYGLQLRQENRQQGSVDRNLTAGAQIASAIGDTPSMINNFQGRGLLGSLGNVDPIDRARLMAAEQLAKSGDIQSAVGFLPQKTAQNYGNPVSAIDEKGRPAYFMTDNSGNIKKVEGFMPEPKKGTSLTVGPDGQIEFNQGGSAIGGNLATTTATQNQLQKDILGSTENLLRLDTLAKDYSKDYLTYYGKGRTLFSSTLEKASGLTPDKEFLAKETAFKNGLEQFFNQYRKDITGAAASVQELDRLKLSMLNADQSPSQFEASMAQFKDLALKTLAAKQKFMSQGIPANDENLGKMIDAEIFQNKNSLGKTEGPSTVPQFSEGAFSARDEKLGLPKGTSFLQYKSKIAQFKG